MAPSPNTPILPLHEKDTTIDDRTARTHSIDAHAGIEPEAPPPPPHSLFLRRCRNEAVAATAEFAGTFMFLFIAFGGTQVAKLAAANSGEVNAAAATSSDVPSTSVLLFVALSFGFSLMVNVWVFFRVSGGLFNPAVTLGLFLVGALQPLRAVICFLVQMAAGIAAAAAISAILPGPLSVSTTLSFGTSIVRGIFLEMFLTSLLVFTIFMLAAEKHKATFLAPIGIGLSLFVAELVGVFFTGGSLNPARSFGPCVVAREFPGYHYVYWVGPVMGTLLAFGVYEIVKIGEYQTVNPGQDFDDQEAALFNAPKNAKKAEEVERPNVAAIVAEEALRMVSQSSGSSSGPLPGIQRRMTPVASNLTELGRERSMSGSGGSPGRSPKSPGKR